MSRSLGSWRRVFTCPEHPIRLYSWNAFLFPRYLEFNRKNVATGTTKPAEVIEPDHTNDTTCQKFEPEIPRSASNWAFLFGAGKGETLVRYSKGVTGYEYLLNPFFKELHEAMKLFFGQILTSRTMRFVPVVASNKNFRSNSQSKKHSSSKDERFEALTEKLKAIKPKSGHRVLCHFTTKTHAHSIQRYGIDITICEKSSEFAIGGGFYLSESIPFGIYWLKAWRFRGESLAVLVFEVPDSFFEGKVCSIIPEADEKWQEFCWYNFNGTRRPPKPMELKSQIVIGPICQRRVIGGSPKDVKPFVTNGRICFQYGIIKQQTADELMLHLKHILTLE